MGPGIIVLRLQGAVLIAVIFRATQFFLSLSVPALLSFRFSVDARVSFCGDWCCAATKVLGTIWTYLCECARWNAVVLRAV